MTATAEQMPKSTTENSTNSQTMTATEEQIPKSTTEGPGSSNSQPSVIASTTTPEPHDGSAAPASQESEPAVAPSGPHTTPAVHTSSEMPASPSHNDVDHPPIPPDTTTMDPKVATLLGMFPDFDVSLLQSVLQSVSGDQDRAIDALLGMSDPEYKSTARPDASQTELDEQIARRLMLEEREQQQQSSWQPHAAYPDVPYQQRSHAAASHPPRGNAQQRPGEGDGMAQFQEQLGKFAETGKKTFNTLFSKVKAKIQEFDNPSPQGQPSGSGNPPSHGDSWNTPAQAQSYYDPNPPPQSLEGYHVAGPEPHPGGISMNQGGVTGTVLPVSAVAPATTSPPTSTAAPVASVDPSKIGLLPKRPVSLGSSSQPSRNPNDDEVEYVESPFEEPKRH